MTSATDYAVAVEAALTRFRDESKWWNNGYQQQVRSELQSALEPCPVAYVESLLARKDLFPYSGDSDEMFRRECTNALAKKKDAAQNPIADLPSEVLDFLGQEPVPNDVLRALAESATLRKEIIQAVQAGFHFGGDTSKSNKPGADAAFTDRGVKKIYVPFSTTNFVRTLMFEIQNALGDGAFRSVETAARTAEISEHQEGSAANFARSIADIEIGNNQRNADLMRQAATETKLDTESGVLRTAQEHLRTVVRGKATVQQDYENAYYTIFLAKLQRYAGTSQEARNEVANLIAAVQGKLDEYARLAAAKADLFQQ
jgi:hypothetical protein